LNLLSDAQHAWRASLVEGEVRSSNASSEVQQVIWRW
jgi:hypothetical protein